MGALKNMPLFEACGGFKLKHHCFIEYLASKYAKQDVVLHLGWEWYLARWSSIGPQHRLFPLFREDTDFTTVRPVLLLKQYNKGLVIDREGPATLC